MEENSIVSAGVPDKIRPKHKDKKFGVSVSDIFRYLRKFLALWIAVSVLVSVVMVSVTAIVKQDSYRKITSLISFTYDGVEKGLDPNGNKFYVNSIKSDDIISEVLDNLGQTYTEDDIDLIGRCITFEGVIPDDAIQRITTHKNVFEGNSAIETAEKIADSTYYPTQYRVHFDYASTEFRDKEAAEFINMMLETYDRVFLDSYGFNRSLSNALNAFSYEEYDYAEALDVFDSNLSKLSTYVSQVASTDTKRFRSDETGLSFADLTDTISTIRSLNLETIDSYVTVNSVTKDKETLLTYYMYRVEELQRQLTVCNETLASVNDSIAKYQKNTVLYFGEGNVQNTDITASITSKEYDELFEKRQSIQSDLSKTAQQINFYNKRIERLNASNQSNSAAKKAKVEEELSVLNDKMNEITDSVVKTTDDYYRSVVFRNAYNVLEPASASAFGVIKHAVKDSLADVITVDAVIFAVYLAVALACAVREASLISNIGGSVKSTLKKASGEKKKKKSREKKSTEKE